jgi:hypothetical protein
VLLVQFLIFLICSLRMVRVHFVKITKGTRSFTKQQKMAYMTCWKYCANTEVIRQFKTFFFNPVTYRIYGDLVRNKILNSYLFYYRTQVLEFFKTKIKRECMRVGLVSCS